MRRVVAPPHLEAARTVRAFEKRTYHEHALRVGRCGGKPLSLTGAQRTDPMHLASSRTFPGQFGKFGPQISWPHPSQLRTGRQTFSDTRPILQSAGPSRRFGPLTPSPRPVERAGQNPGFRSIRAIAARLHHRNSRSAPMSLLDATKLRFHRYQRSSKTYREVLGSAAMLRAR